jgi:predicted phage baseplate assembly protein
VAPQIRAAEVNVLPVVQRRPEAPAVLATGTGQPDQEVAVVTADLASPMEIRVGDEVWQARADLARSGPGDPHYAVFDDHVLFGNGVNGRRPPLGASIRHTGLVHTLGGAGNLRSGLTWSVPALGSQVYGQNREALAGGADRTTPDDLARAARQAAVARAALLTDADLKAAAEGLTGMAVGRAEVLPLFDRRLPGRRVDGTRTLVVIPRQPPWSGRGRPPAPVWPSQAYLDAVAARLASRRVLGERLVVQGPEVVAVDVELQVSVAAGGVAANVEAAAQAAVFRRLGPQAWPLGRALTVVDLEEAVAVDVPAVEQVVAVRIGAAGGPLGPDPVAVPQDGLVTAGQVQVSVGGGRAR